MALAILLCSPELMGLLSECAVSQRGCKKVSHFLLVLKSCQVVPIVFLLILWRFIPLYSVMRYESGV